MPRATALLVVAVLAVLTGSAAPAAAGEVHKEIKLEFDRWIDLKASDGPVTLHRFRLVRNAQGSIKSRLARPSNSRYLEDVRLEVEYSNEATRDWELVVRGEWSDARGEVIDGVDQSESLDEGERFQSVTITFPTLRYGLDRGAKLQLDLSFAPD